MISQSSKKLLIILAAIVTWSCGKFQPILNEDMMINSHPKVGAIDKFCSVSSTFNNTCTIKAKTIRLTYDTVYET